MRARGSIAAVALASTILAGNGLTATRAHASTKCHILLTCTFGGACKNAEFDAVFDTWVQLGWTKPDFLNDRASTSVLEGTTMHFRQNVQNAESDMVMISPDGHMVWTTHSTLLDGSFGVYIRIGTCEARR